MTTAALTIDTAASWRLYWGPGPLPEGAAALGVIDMPYRGKGAVIRLLSGQYVQGNAGGIRSLPQHDCIRALDWVQQEATASHDHAAQERDDNTEAAGGDLWREER